MAAENKIQFEYRRSDDYRIVAANGAHGGVTSRGDFRFDLFVEGPKAPEFVVHSITPDGLGPEVEREPSGRIVERELQIGVVMSPTQAKSLAQWILSRLSAMPQDGGKSSPGPGKE
jgi:hypothetical protein